MKKKPQLKDSETLKRLRSTEYARRLGQNIIMPKAELIDLKTNYCGLCGKRKEKSDSVKWFGEEFHKECVKGLDPEGHYDKNLKGRRGFSRG